MPGTRKAGRRCVRVGPFERRRRLHQYTVHVIHTYRPRVACVWCVTNVVRNACQKKKIIGPSVVVSVVTGAEDLTVGRGVPFSRNAGLPLSDEDHRRCRRRRRRHADTTCAPLYCVITYIINDDAYYNNKMYSYAYDVMCVLTTTIDRSTDVFRVARTSRSSQSASAMVFNRPNLSAWLNNSENFSRQKRENKKLTISWRVM